MLLTNKRAIRPPEITGAWLAPVFHIRNAARMKLPAMRIIHSACAGPQGNSAKGAMKMKAAGG